MPPFETMDLKQKAVLFTFKEFDDYGGNLYFPPEEISVRWVDKRIDTNSSNTNLVNYDCGIVVKKDLVVKSIFYKGCLDDLQGTPQPEFSPDESFFIVERFQKTSDIKNRFIRRIAYLNRYKDSFNFEL